MTEPTPYTDAELAELEATAEKPSGIFGILESPGVKRVAGRLAMAVAIGFTVIQLLEQIRSVIQMLEDDDARREEETEAEAA